LAVPIPSGYENADADRELIQCENRCSVIVSAKRPDAEWSSGSAAPVIVDSVIAASVVGSKLNGSNTVGPIDATSKALKASWTIGTASAPTVSG